MSIYVDICRIGDADVSRYMSIYVEDCRYSRWGGTYKNLAEKISEKKDEQYSEIMRYLRVKLSFFALKATLLCLRGSRSVFNNIAVETTDFTLTLNELGL